MQAKNGRPGNSQEIAKKIDKITTSKGPEKYKKYF
jgi:hypothetical protein